MISIKYKYSGAKSLVMLHAEKMKLFLKSWKKAKELKIKLPSTDDPDYNSLEQLLCHVLRSSGGYLLWICKNLNLPHPKIENVPDISKIESESEKYLEMLLKKWETPLAEIDQERIVKEIYISNWGVQYSIEAMLEHAVMHPIRHEFQLKQLMQDSFM